MSDLATVENLSKPAPQLPAAWYFDAGIAALEEERLFRGGPGYVGHELMIPNRGDYIALDGKRGAKALVRGDSGVELLTNVCRHRQAVMLRGRGNTGNIVCPLHRWTYDLGGKLIGAPYFETNPCLDLGRTPLRAWNGLLFDGPRDPAVDLAGLGVAADLDFSGYVFDHSLRHEYAFNWKTFIEVYLEDYHVVPFHPGLGQFVDCENLRWQFGDWFSVQTVGVKDALARPGTPTYARFHKAVLDFTRGVPPTHGAIWLVYYPNVMIEWYPHVLVVSTVWPDGPEKCVNVVEFYYPEEVALFERELVEAERAAYEETAVEDEEICLRMTEGRRHLIAQGIEQFGPYQLPTELGMQHFHRFIRRHMQPPV
jgi:choline monooxygenase